VTEEQARGLIGLGHRLVGGLPAPFLALLGVVAILVVSLFLHLNAQLDARERVLLKLLDSCVPHSSPS
jgi:hypothetical protein